jgi:hypothetical protein
MIKGLQKKPSSLTNDLRHYYDEFTVFNNRCVRLCKALALITNQRESFNSYSIRGMRHNINWLQHRVDEFNRKLNTLYEKALREEK